MSAGFPVRFWKTTLCCSAGKSHRTDWLTRMASCVGVNVFCCIVTTPATEPAVTVIAKGGDANPDDVAMITADPGATPITRPVVFTLTIPAGDAAYVIFAPPIVTPFASRAVVVNCTGSPTAIVCFGAVTTTENTDGDAGLLEPHAASTNVVARSPAVLTLFM